MRTIRRKTNFWFPAASESDTRNKRFASVTLEARDV
jgi:hypothetical protein